MVAYSSKIKRADRRHLFRGRYVFTLLALAVFCVLFVFLNVRVFKKFLFLREKREKLTEQVSRLERERNILLRKISAVQDKEFLERVARDDLNLKKKGEKVVAFSFEGVSSSTSGDLSPGGQSQGSDQKRNKISAWQKFLKWLRLR